jgi:hypothetical protein
MSITAIVENDMIKLPPSAYVPNGTKARVVFESEMSETFAARYADLIGITDPLPEDLAENHDHYLHHPKRG